MVHKMPRGMVINCVAYAQGRRLRDVTIDAIGQVLENPAAFVWVGLLEPSEELLREVQSQFGLHDLAIEDAHRAHQRPKIEAYGNTLFIVLHTAQVWEDTVHFGETHIFLGERYLVSVRHGASATYAEVRARRKQSGLARSGSGLRAPCLDRFRRR
jgi:magnesium transporter